LSHLAINLQVFPAFGQLKLEVITSNDQVGKKDNVEPCQT
jgi:hypothetical protein